MKPLFRILTILLFFSIALVSCQKDEKPAIKKQLLTADAGLNTTAAAAAIRLCLQVL
jgi:hypothetical protein